MDRPTQANVATYLYDLNGIAGSVAAGTGPPAAVMAAAAAQAAAGGSAPQTPNSASPMVHMNMNNSSQLVNNSNNIMNNVGGGNVLNQTEAIDPSANYNLRWNDYEKKYAETFKVIYILIHKRTAELISN